MKKTRLLILGAGSVGTAVAHYLSNTTDFKITAADISDENLSRIKDLSNATVVKQDLSDPSNIAALVSDFDITVGALPGNMGMAALKAAVSAGKNYCDVSFMPQNALELDELAKKNNVTAVVDCGVAPGLSHMMAGRGAAALDNPTSITIVVGGIPEKKEPPFYYKASFHPADVIEEYVRPARIKVNGKIVTKPALSDIEQETWPEVGEVETFLTDGLRTLLYTLDVPNMTEKTLRWPGHAELIKTLRHIGLLSYEPIKINNTKIKPVDVFSSLVKPIWKYGPKEKDLTIMRVRVEGEKNGKHSFVEWKLLDSAKGWLSSMARTTGFPCAETARMLAEGLIHGPGIIPPEYIGKDKKLFTRIKNELIKHEIKITEDTQVEV